jgi:hypothetical protein
MRPAENNKYLYGFGILHYHPCNPRYPRFLFCDGKKANKQTQSFKNMDQRIILNLCELCASVVKLHLLRFAEKG